jgi:hypothetical protein
MVLSLFLALDLYNMYQISSFVQGKRSILGLTFVMVIRAWRFGASANGIINSTLKPW